MLVTAIFRLRQRQIRCTPKRGGAGSDLACWSRCCSPPRVEPLIRKTHFPYQWRHQIPPAPDASEFSKSPVGGAARYHIIVAAISDSQGGAM